MPCQNRHGMLLQIHVGGQACLMLRPRRCCRRTFWTPTSRDCPEELHVKGGQRPQSLPTNRPGHAPVAPRGENTCTGLGRSGWTSIAELADLHRQRIQHRHDIQQRGPAALGPSVRKVRADSALVPGHRYRWSPSRQRGIASPPTTTRGREARGIPQPECSSTSRASRSR